MKHLPLGTRITLLSAVVTAFGILLCGVATTLLVYHEEVEELDIQLTAEGERFLDEWTHHGGPNFEWNKQPDEPREWAPAAEPPRWLEVVDTQEQILYRTSSVTSDVLHGTAPGFHSTSIGEEGMRVAVFKREGITLRLAADLDPVNELTQSLATSFLLSLPVVLGFIFLGGRLIARQALRPIQEITESAEKLTAQRLDQRVPVPPARDEIHRLAIVLNSTFDRLDQSFQQAIRFTADASHELKTPLTVLRTSTEVLLRSKDLSAADQDSVAGILEQTKRLASITCSLLLLSQADAGKLKLDLTPGDLNEIVGLCVDDARIIAENQRIEIETDLPSCAIVSIDPLRAAQIVMNLLDNAVKYNQPEGIVRVTLVKDQDVWRLRVSNTGPGIPADVAPQLFIRFFRGAHTAEIGGHGLGLSLARELALAHGGELSLIPSDLGWTTFELSIPFTAAVRPPNE